MNIAPARRRFLADGCIVLAIAASSQVPSDLVRLTTPQARLSRPFTWVEGIRELSDGRAVVLDHGDRAVHFVDFRWNTRRAIGRVGSGPGEYLLPARIFPLLKDSTGIFDIAAKRALVIAPDGHPVRFFNPYPRRGTGPAGELQLSPISSTDTNGAYYSLAQPVRLTADGRLDVADSNAIERWTASSLSRDTMGYLPFPYSRIAVVLQGVVTWQPQRPRPFAPRPCWTVGMGGQVAIVRPSPYRVELVRGGYRTTGPPIPYRPVRLGEQHKQEWRENQQRPAFGIIQEGTGSPVSVRARPRRAIEPLGWPPFLPPFHPDKCGFDNLGRLWIRRHVSAGEDPLFDIVSHEGRVLYQVRAPPRTRLVGFGRGWVYLVRQDTDDLEWLERYHLPK